MLLKIKDFRKLKNLSQQNLADKIQVSVRMLGEYEKQTTDIGIVKLQKIAEVLQISILDLIELEENEKIKVKQEEPLNELIAAKNEIIQRLKEENSDLKSKLISCYEKIGVEKSRTA